MTKTAVKERVETVIAEEAPLAQLPAVRQEAPPRPAERPEPKAYAPRIAKAIIAVTREIGKIQKEGYNDFQRYKYTRWEDINEKLSPLLSDHGLIIVQNEQSRNLLEQNDKGSVLAIVYEFTIINEHGESWPPVEWTAIARLRDGKGVSDDKAATKCHTQAEKYFCLKQFKIVTDDAIDGDRPTLTKAESRELFFRLQRELEEAQDREAVRAWGAQNKARVELLPNDFQERLRLRYRAKLLDPTSAQPDPAEAWGDKQAGHMLNAMGAHDPETGEIAETEATVVWDEDDERPATDADLGSPQVPPAAQLSAPPQNGTVTEGGADNLSGLSIEDMAREAATRGEDVLKSYRKGLDAAGRARVDAIGAELRSLMPKEGEK